MKREERHPKYNEFLIACCESPGKAEYLLRTHPELLEAANGSGETLLHYLAIENRCEAVDFLIKQGAQVNTRDHSGATPLMHAVSLGHLEMATLLLKAGADPNIRDLIYTSTLDSAATLEAGCEQMIDLLLRHGADVDIRDDNLGETPLMRAAAAGRADAVQLLIGRGADMQARDHWGNTVLHVAADGMGCTVDVIELLLKAGADPCARNDEGEAPYKCAVWNQEVAEALAKATGEEDVSWL